ncbi:MAG: lycopene cyclase domain-containing protein [Bacteroidales bacterium]|nr:lycopene cyclase domain-containing protein [Bacteroidales bacterium]
MNNLYLYLNIFTLLFPLLLSFDRKVAFYREWRFLFPAILIMGVFFIGKDVIFAANDIWAFNDDYLIGVRILGLPVEEWMFFFTVPYACVFIYACLIAYLKADPLKNIHRPFLFVLAIALLVIAAFNYQKLYTSIVFAITAMLLLYNLVIRPPWLSMFLLAYFVVLVPFLLVNGLLTGSFIGSQVVSYNPDHNLNIRILTIPVEDSIYNLLMLLMTVQLMEWFKSRHKQTEQRKETPAV